MCLDKIKGPFIAKKDIVCYKYFYKDYDGTLISPYKHYKWLNKTETASLVRTGDNSIREGLHSFVKEADCKKDAKAWGNITEYSVRKMIIPKGATYYKGTFEKRPSLASNTLRFITFKKVK